MIALEISIVIILFLIITLLILNCMKYQEGFDAGMGLSFGQFYSQILNVVQNKVVHEDFHIEEVYMKICVNHIV